MYDKLLNKYVIARCNNAGVFFGKLLNVEETISGTTINLTDARKLYYWAGAYTVENLANAGVSRPEECKFTKPHETIVITQLIQIIPCNKKAIINLKNVPVWTI